MPPSWTLSNRVYVALNQQASDVASETGGDTGRVIRNVSLIDADHFDVGRKRGVRGSHVVGGDVPQRRSADGCAARLQIVTGIQRVVAEPQRRHEWQRVEHLTFGRRGEAVKKRGAIGIERETRSRRVDSLCEE